MTRVRHNLVGVPALALLAVTALTALALAAVTPAASAVGAVPYTDPSAHGYIGLCDQSGHQITSGRVGATPFVWRAVSSVPAPAAYDGAGRTATLLGYLPMKALPPGNWSGELLTSSTRYSNPTVPTAVATARDESLSALLADFPAQWDGFYELRIYLGAPDRETYEVTYPVLNIQVKGDKWYAVGGGPVNCQAGSAESVESILLPGSATAPSKSPQQPIGSPTTAAPQAAGASSTGVTGGGHTGGTRAASSTGGGATTADAAPGRESAGATAARAAAGPASSSKDGSGPTTGIVAALAVAAIVAGAGVYVVRRRRRAAPSPER